MNIYRSVLLTTLFVLAACGASDTGAPAATVVSGAQPTRPPVAPTSTPAPAPAPATAVPIPPVEVATAQIGQPVVVGEGVAVPAITTGPQQSPTPLRGPRIITLTDNQQNLLLAVNDTFVLQLDEAMEWNISADDPQIVVPVDGKPRTYIAKTRGQTSITAVGEPLCRNAQPACMMPSMLFRLVLIVK